jgi:hypothetical protein
MDAPCVQKIKEMRKHCLRAHISQHPDFNDRTPHNGRHRKTRDFHPERDPIPTHVGTGALACPAAAIFAAAHDFPLPCRDRYRTSREATA